MGYLNSKNVLLMGAILLVVIIVSLGILISSYRTDVATDLSELNVDYLNN